MGVSVDDIKNICTKVYGEDMGKHLFDTIITQTLIETIIVEDWDRNLLTPAERVAVRMVWKALKNDGQFNFDPDDIKRNCNNCANVTKDRSDCSVYNTQGTCHLSIPNLWVAKKT